MDVPQTLARQDIRPDEISGYLRGLASAFGLFTAVAASSSTEVGPLPLRVLIVDDSETTRRILRTIIHSHYWFVCGEAESGWSGVRKFEELKPDVVVLDLSMPDISAIEAAKWMTESDPTVPLILFTVLETEGIESVARQAGIRAIVSKSQVWKLLTSIETAINQNSN
jgi:two-component system, chemotaxis family, chemotaxis protein CheY